MSGTHKERHQWKDKERQREGESDPAKIKLHRERFLARLEDKNEPVSSLPQLPSGRVAMQLRLLTIPDPSEPKTLIYRNGKEIGQAEHWALDPSDVEYVIAAAEGIENLDAKAEAQRLREHVEMIQKRGLDCHLEVLQNLTGKPDGEVVRLCEACFPCSFRKWGDEISLPLCTRPNTTH